MGLKAIFLFSYSFFIIIAIAIVSLGVPEPNSSIWSILLFGIGVLLAIFLTIFTVSIFIQRIFYVFWMQTEAQKSVTSLIVNNFLLTMLSIISLLFVLIYIVCNSLLIKDNLYYDTIINSLVMRFDVTMNLISILYSMDAFEPYYLFFCRICDTKFKYMLEKESKISVVLSIPSQSPVSV